MTYYKCGSIHPTQNSNVVVDTASGAIANFQTSLAMPLLKTRFDFKAAQDLHGQSGPYPAGGSAQKWDEETVNGYLSSTDGSFISHNTSICSKNFNPILPSTSYYMYKGSSIPVSYIYWYDSNQDFISRDALAGLVVTTPNNAAYFKVSCYGYGATYKNDISVNYPATDTAYHPYSNICPIDGVSEINGVYCKKNLFNLDYLTASGITIQNGEASGTAYAFSVSFGANAKGLKNKVKFKANTQYTLKFKAYTDANAETQYVGLKVYFWYTDGNTASVLCPNNTLSYTDFSVSSHANKTIDYISISYSTGWANTWHLKDIQLEEGSTATDFEPYNGSTILINLGGTYYGGYVSQDKDGKREGTITWCNITDLGSLNWGTSNDGRVICNPSDMAIVPLSSIIGNILSDCYKPDTHNNVWNRITDNTIAVTNNPNAKMVLYDSNLGTKTSDEVKAYLSGKSVIYEIAEPFTIPLPDGQPIKSLPGVNNIFADTGDTSLQFRKIG